MLRMQLVTEQVRLLFGSINDTGGFSRQCHSIVHAFIGLLFSGKTPKIGSATGDSHHSKH